MSNAFDKLKKRATTITKSAPDMRVAEKGGYFDPPAAGTARMRFIGYIELGTQPDTFQGRPKDAKKVRLVFELSGKKHPPIEGKDGEVYPRRMSVTLTHSNNEKAALFKLFARMNPGRTYSHIAQMLGDPFLGKIFHDTYKVQNGNEVTVARLRPKGGEYHVDPPYIEDVETGEVKEVVVAEPTSEPMIFFWDSPSLEDWDNLFIDGEYDDGRSKNVIQDTLRRAVDWVDSPMYKLLEEDGRDEDTYSPLDPPAYVMSARGGGDDDAENTSVKKDTKSTKTKQVEDDEDEEEAPKPKKTAPKKVIGDDEDEVSAPVADDDVGPVEAKAKKAPAKKVVDDDEDLDDENGVPSAVNDLLDGLD